MIYNMPGDQLAWPEPSNQCLPFLLEVRIARKGIHRWAILLLERKAGKPCFPNGFQRFPNGVQRFYFGDALCQERYP